MATVAPRMSRGHAMGYLAAAGAASAGVVAVGARTGGRGSRTTNPLLLGAILGV